jgi:CRP-like cAMP-binding protein
MDNSSELNNLIRQLMANPRILSGDILKESRLRSGQIIQARPNQKISAYIVVSGMVKVYGLNLKYREFIIDFYSKNEMIILFDKHQLHIEAIDDTNILSINLEAFENQINHSLELSIVWCEILKNMLKRKMHREYELLTMNAKQRYDNLIQLNSSVLQSVTQRQLASYLGITPVAMTRLKRNGKTSYEITKNDKLQ